MAKTKAFKITQNNQYIQEISLNAGEYTFSANKIDKQTNNVHSHKGKWSVRTQIIGATALMIKSNINT